MSLRMTAAVLVCGFAAACSHQVSRTVVVPASDGSCVAYGFTPGTAAYAQCAQRQAASRAGDFRRPAADYRETRAIADAQQVCASYGLAPGSERHGRCVQRELEARLPN